MPDRLFWGLFLLKMENISFFSWEWVFLDPFVWITDYFKNSYGEISICCEALKRRRWAFSVAALEREAGHLSGHPWPRGFRCDARAWSQGDWHRRAGRRGRRRCQGADCAKHRVSKWTYRSQKGNFRHETVFSARAEFIWHWKRHQHAFWCLQCLFLIFSFLSFTGFIPFDDHDRAKAKMGKAVCQKFILWRFCWCHVELGW